MQADVKRLPRRRSAPRRRASSAATAGLARLQRFSVAPVDEFNFRTLTPAPQQHVENMFGAFRPTAPTNVGLLW